MVNSFFCMDYINFMGYIVSKIVDWDCDKFVKLLI